MSTQDSYQPKRLLSEQLILNKPFEVEIQNLIIKNNVFDLLLDYEGEAVVHITYKTDDTDWRDYVILEVNDVYKSFIENALRNEDLYIKFRFSSITEVISLTELKINNVDYLIEDVYKITFITLLCKNEISNCGTYDPYLDLHKIHALGQCDSDFISDAYGHDVLYFKVDPIKQSEIYTLKTWQKYTTNEPKHLKVIIPDNVLPENLYVRNQHDTTLDNMTYLISFNRFKRAFGQTTEPNVYDFFYIKKLERVVEIIQVDIKYGVDYNPIHWEVIVGDYRDKNIVEKDREMLINGANDIYQLSIDDLQADFQNIAEERAEQRDVLLSDQQNTSVDLNLLKGLGKTDAYRENISKLAYIKNYDLKNFGVQISNHVYTSTRAKFLKEDQIILVEYKNPYSLFEGKELSFMLWVYFGGNKRYSSDIATFNDCYLRLDENMILSARNGNETLNLDTPLEFNKWYGVCVNINYRVCQMRLTVYERTYDVNFPRQNLTNELKVVDTKTINTSTDIPFEHGNGSFLFESSGAIYSNIKLYAQTFDQQSEVIELQKTKTTNRNLLIFDLPYPTYKIGRITT